MGMFKELEYSSISVKDLLGRTLNDVEIKYAPKILHIAGPMEIPLPRPRVSIIGSRKASTKGLEAAQTITKTLAENKTVIVSGLAEGIDTAAHKAAIATGGKTVAVIGTPLNKVYPQKNFELQEEIMNNHLVISQFSIGHPTTPKDFVLRNRTMALISDATIIVEAGDTSGSLHQGWEALRLGRPLFIWKSIFSNTKLIWPEKMLQYGAMELSDPWDMFEILPSHLEILDVFQ
ncbi:MAG: DNA-protecting protein DprA [Candidatus Nitrosotalea sp.]|nr:DNA-protecting protein DprA [Candidatus Nitrosotalea sp.]